MNEANNDRFEFSMKDETPEAKPTADLQGLAGSLTSTYR
jgi:hypothetical protein